MFACAYSIMLFFSETKRGSVYRVFFQDVSCNRLGSLPLEIGVLRKLRVLNVRQNMLIQLPYGSWCS